MENEKMKTDTPRVTVPVEPTEAMMKAADAVDWNNEDERASVINMWQAMLSAAPAPEGGAVNDALREMLALVLLKYGNLDEAVNAAVERAQSALATREEAPAEAGREEIGRLIVAFMDDKNGGDHRHKSLKAADAILALRAQPPAREEVGCAEPEVGRAVYERIENLIDVDPNGWERRYLSNLVESVEEVGGYDGPPAREDAQPVARISPDDVAKMTAFANNHGTVEDWHVWCRIRSALTTHPAPDALWDALSKANEMTGADDARLTNRRDFGFANVPSMAWSTHSDKDDDQ